MERGDPSDPISAFESIRSRVLQNATKRLACEDFKTESALDVLKLLMQMMDKYKHLSGSQKKDIVIRTFEDIAAGKDGILGTADDLIPAYVLTGMRIMIESELVERTIDVIYEATIGKVLQTYSLTSSIYSCLCALFCCCGCRGRNKNEYEPLLR
jgi:hypothetical protein